MSCEFIVGLSSEKVYLVDDFVECKINNKKKQKEAIEEKNRVNEVKYQKIQKNKQFTISHSSDQTLRLADVNTLSNEQSHHRNRKSEKQSNVH